MDSPLSSLKLELTQLKELHRTGKLPDAAFEEACRALERRIVDAVPAESGPIPVPVVASSSLNLWWALLAVVLAIAGVAYEWKESPGVVATVAPAASPMATVPAPDGAPHDTGSDQFAAMVDGLARKLKDKPQDADGWTMLARSYAALGRHAEAVAAFERAMALRPNDPMLMAGYADSVAVKNKGAVVAGTASATSPPPPINSAGVANASVSGTVSLAPSTAKMAGPEDTVFIIARSAQGERVPLAVLRKQVKDLPLRFTLDDSMAMSLQNRLSGATQVVVSARISKSGQAMPQSGDLAGQAAPVTVGTSGVAIEIRDLVK